MSKIYREIGKLIKNSSERSEYMLLRAQHLSPSLVKQAFDTRRIDQNLEYNPRRNLQYYQRSEAFINDEFDVDPTSISVREYCPVIKAIDLTFVPTDTTGHTCS